MGAGSAQLLQLPVSFQDRGLIRSACRPSQNRFHKRFCNVSSRSLVVRCTDSVVTPRGSPREIGRCPREAPSAFAGRGSIRRVHLKRGGRSLMLCSGSGVTESSPDTQEILPAITPDILGASPAAVSSEILPSGLDCAENGMEVIQVMSEVEIDTLTAVREAFKSTTLQTPGPDFGVSAEITDILAPRRSLDGAELSRLNEEKEESRGNFVNRTADEQLAASPLKTSNVNKSIFDHMRDIFVFAGPALGIWLSGPLMSIIDTAVIGNSSSLELAALGPGTVLCDQSCFVFMFLSIATSNLIATALAHKDEAEAAGHISRLLFVSLFCGVTMLVLTECFATPLLQAFVGVKNYSLIPASRLYVQIRALAWPLVLMGMVAQSASLGMQDSWGPLNVLIIASSVNLFGDILLCTVLGYGIGGAAWATAASQYVGGFLMLKSLGDKGYNPLAIAVPSLSELVHMVELAAPILLTMLSKVAFYTIITFLATSLGSVTLAAHQVMIGIFSLCTVCGEPLSQTAQSFMPSLIYGSDKDLKQARVLLRTLILIGVVMGASLGSVAVSVPWLFPQIFTSDPGIISQMRSITIPFFISLMLTPPTLSCEGTLLAGRDLKFLGFSMASCFCGGTFLLITLNKLGLGLKGSWWTLVAFQLTRFIQSYSRLAGDKSILLDELPSGEEAQASIHLKQA